VDAIRDGRARERELAIQEIKRTVATIGKNRTN